MHNRQRFLVISADAVGRDLLVVSLKRRQADVEVLASTDELAEQVHRQESPFTAAFVDMRMSPPGIDLRCSQLLPHRKRGNVGHIVVVVERNDIQRRRVIDVHGADALLVWPPEGEDMDAVLALMTSHPHTPGEEVTGPPAQPIHQALQTADAGSREDRTSPVRESTS